MTAIHSLGYRFEVTIVLVFRGSTASTIDLDRTRSYFGNASARSAPCTVFPRHPHHPGDRLIGIPSARCNRRISAQSSTGSDTSSRPPIRLAGITRPCASGGLEVTHQDPTGVIAFKRWNSGGDVVLVVVNASDTSYTGTSYGVATGQAGRWQQILCSQDAWFGGWDGAGNAFYEPSTQADGRIFINAPQWSVTMFRLL